jgi:serine/threonine protein kinase
MSESSKNPGSTSEQEVFGPYVVLERLGVGGMATVHRAKVRGIEGFERIVALKRLLPHLAEDASFVKSFVREAKLASKLQHANIVQLYELGRVHETYYIAMEHLDGRDVRRILLQARRTAGPPNLNVTLSLLIQLCDALEYAHTRTDDNGEPLGIVHRDVSPSNLFVNRSGHLKVIDFGIAKAQTSQLLTQDGKVKGKLAYMAPEAITGGVVDARSDIFSVGVIAHELLTAKALFASKSEYQTLINVQRSEIQPPSAFNQAVPRELDEVVARALARNPAQRYATAAQMRDDLHAIRTRYNLSATNREVEAWCNWAFSLGRAGSFGDPASTSSLTGLSKSQSRTPVPGVAASDEDDEAAAIAWGGVPESSPPVVHELPDVSSRSASISVRRTPVPALSGPDFGNSIVGPRKSNTVARGVAIGVAVALVGGAGYLVLGRGSNKAVASSASLNPAAGADVQMASVKFIVEPGDATIKIAGMPPHVGAPWTVELDPGVVQIKVSHDGHQSWETSIELSEAENQTIRVALAEVQGDPNLATMEIGSQPAGLAIVLDGVEVEQRTPWKTQLPPGPHTVQLRDPSGAIAWKHSWNVEARTLYEFNPSMTAAKQQERVERERQVRVGGPLPGRTVDAGTGSASASAAVAAAPAVGVGSAPASGSAAVPAPAPAMVAEAAAAKAAPAPGVATAPAPGSSTTGAVPAPAKAAPTRVATAVPAPSTAARPAPAAKVIAPNAVKRTSGSLPTLKTVLRPGMEVPKSMAAKICINESGGVTSVQVLKVSGELASTLASSIRAWRYTAYKEGGVAMPACFVNSFSLSQ